MESSTVNVEATRAYNLISGNLGRVGCDQVAHGDSSNDIKKLSSSLDGANFDLVDHLASGDSSKFETYMEFEVLKVIRTVLVT